MKYRHSRRLMTAPGVFFVALILSCATLGHAQLTIGDYLHMTMNGSAGAGYTGGFGNFGHSSHGMGFGFDGLLNGYYFSPKFIGFDFRPYFNRIQANSDYQSLERGTGVGGSANFFSNSFFPGSFSIGMDNTMNGEYQVAGVPSVSSDSTSLNTGVTWSVLLPGKPTLTATYGIGHSDSSITGTDMTSTSSSRVLTLNSTFLLAGWHMFGTFGHYNNSFTTPEFLTGTAISRSGSGNNVSFTTSHTIPLGGSVSLGASRTSASNSDNDSDSGYSLSGSVGITPFRRLGLSSSFTYSSNSAAFLSNSLLGGLSTTNVVDNRAKLYFWSNSASVFLGHGLSIIGHMAWREEDYGYANYTDMQYGGTLSYRYSHRWLGTFYASAGLVDTANKVGNAGAGLTATVGMDRHFGRWETSADFNYMQDVQTLYSFATTSYLNYGGTVRRKLNPDTYVSTFYRATHSGLETQSGVSNMSQSFGGSLAWKGYAFSGNYSASSGAAVLSANGSLVPTPLGPTFTPDFVYFNARAFGVSAAKAYFRRLHVSAAYSQVSSATEKPAGTNSASGNRFGVTTSYPFRRLMFTGGFNRSQQEFTGMFGPPRVVDSYYGTVTRWFNIF